MHLIVIILNHSVNAAVLWAYIYYLCYLQTTASESGLFDYLINIWEFNPGSVPGTCDLYFLVDFKFQSPLYRQVFVLWNLL